MKYLALHQKVYSIKIRIKTTLKFSISVDTILDQKVYSIKIRIKTPNWFLKTRVLKDQKVYSIKIRIKTITADELKSHIYTSESIFH